MALKDVSDNLKTRGMFEKAINIEPWLLAYVPDNLKIQGVCKKAVEEDTSMLKYVPDQYIMQEMCIKARDFPWLIGHVPEKKCVPGPLRYAHGYWSISPIGLRHKNK